MECASTRSCADSYVEIQGFTKFNGGLEFGCLGTDSCHKMNMKGMIHVLYFIYMYYTYVLYICTLSIEHINDITHIILALNVENLQCYAPNSCGDARFNVEGGVRRGVNLDCGVNGCSNSFMDIANIRNLNCTNPNSCENTQMNLHAFNKKFFIQCGKNGCTNSNIQVLIDDTTIGS